MDLETAKQHLEKLGRDFRLARNELGRLELREKLLWRLVDRQVNLTARFAWEVRDAIELPTGKLDFNFAQKMGAFRRDTLQHAGVYLGACRNADYAAWDEVAEKFIPILTPYDEPTETTVNGGALPCMEDAGAGQDYFLPVLRVR